ncbi:ChrR family anti-sigma-E factor [Pelagibius sp. 7325]|uniref:ChrR family anti-sigma-E factor n=1 Tax=Pelagibius sp. 7325 TaxID=3131994 RepID=UPI0030EC48C1
MTARLSAHHPPAHHLDDALLFDYATGALGEALALVVASHVALCEICRGTVAAAEAAGGALLAEIAPAVLAPDALERTLARLDAEEAAASPPPPGAAAEWRLPGPLVAYLGEDPAALDWQPLAAGVDAAALHPLAAPAWPMRTQVLLVRLAPGAMAPRHTHEGIEATVILQGGFADQFGQYERGDAWIVDASVTHAPVALPDETCLCLAYYDAPMKAVPLTPIVSSI